MNSYDSRAETNNKNGGLLIERKTGESFFIIPQKVGEIPIKIQVYLKGKILCAARIRVKAGNRENYLVVREESLINGGEEYLPMLAHLNDGKNVTQGLLERLRELIT